MKIKKKILILNKEHRFGILEVNFSLNFFGYILYTYKLAVGQKTFTCTTISISLWNSYMNDISTIPRKYICSTYIFLDSSKV